RTRSVAIVYESERECQTLARRRWGPLARRHKVGRPPAHNEPYSRHNPTVEPGQGREEPFGGAVESAAHSEVRPANAEPKTDRSRRRVEREMWDQMWRRPPHSLSRELLKRAGQARPSQESRRGHDAPIVELTGITSQPFDARKHCADSRNCL